MMVKWSVAILEVAVLRSSELNGLYLPLYYPACDTVLVR